VPLKSHSKEEKAVPQSSACAQLQIGKQENESHPQIRVRSSLNGVLQSYTMAYTLTKDPLSKVV